MNWFNSFLRIYPSEAAWIMHTIQEWFSNHWDLVWLTVRIFFTLRCLECYTDLADLQKHIKRSLQVHALQTRRVIILLCLTSLEDVTSLICSGNSTTVEAWDVRRRYDCFFLLAWKYSDIAVRLLTHPHTRKFPRIDKSTQGGDGPSLDDEGIEDKQDSPYVSMDTGSESDEETEEDSRVSNKEVCRSFIFFMIFYW